MMGTIDKKQPIANKLNRVTLAPQFNHEAFARAWVSFMPILLLLSIFIRKQRSKLMTAFGELQTQEYYRGMAAWL